MNKKYLKIGALVVAGVLIVGLGLFANALLGNPISKAAATSSAKKYVAETYAGTDYYVENVSYNFKDGNYHAFVKSPSSMDTEFSLHVNMIGKIYFDTYENVTSGYNTARRLEQEYRVLVDTVLESTTFPYVSDIRYGTLEIFPEEYLNNPEINDIPAYALNQNELELDKI